MKKKTGILGVLIAILLIGIGYAAISAVTLTITGSGTISPSNDNFKVVYTAGEQATGGTAGVTATPAAIASDGTISTTFTVSGMTKTGDTVSVEYTIQNKSPELKAVLGTPSVVVSNSTYFSATSSIATPTTLNPNGTTTQTVTVTAIKTPVSADETTTVTVTVVADPSNS